MKTMDTTMNMHMTTMTMTMKTIRRAASGALVAGLLLAGGSLASPAVAQDAVAPDDARIALAPTPIRGIVAARPFRVDTPFEHTWRQDRPEVTGGWLLVLDVDSELVYPRQTAMPVLYAGLQTAARVNVGYTSGRLVVIVPDRLGKDGLPVTKLADLPIWFGDADLPERIDAADIAAARAAADAAGIAARPEAERTAAVARGRQQADLDAGGVATYADRMQLMLAAMRLVKQYAPDETELADGWLIPAGG
jgi:hypothetical protein